MPISSQAHANRVTTAADIYVEEGLTSSASYVDYMIGGLETNYGVGGLFKIILHSATVGLDYVLEEAISQNGPFKQIDSGSVLAGAVGEINYDADGVLYGLILRFRVKHTSTAGSYGLQMSVH
jgi:hypothetical protein